MRPSRRRFGQIINGLDADQDARFVVVMLGAGLTVVLLQILANFANDLGDFQNGTDTAAERNDRALASGALTETAMKRAVKGTAVLAFLCGVSTLVAAFLILFCGLPGVRARGPSACFPLLQQCVIRWDVNHMVTKDLETFT